MIGLLVDLWFLDNIFIKICENSISCIFLDFDILNREWRIIFKPTMFVLLLIDYMVVYHVHGQNTISD